LRPACDRDNRLPERKPSRCTCRLDTGRGDVPGRHAGVVGNQGTDVLLPDKPACAHVPDIHRIDLLARELCVLEGKCPCLDKDITERALPLLSELRAPDPDNCYVSHDCITIFPLCFAYRA